MNIRQFHKYIAIASALLVAACVSSCGGKDISNKAERNAIRAGNKMYDKGEYNKALEKYNEAIAANGESEAAQYNSAIAKLHKSKPDSATLASARKTLETLGTSGRDATISEHSLYNLGNDAVYLGDMLKAAGAQGGNGADQMNQMSTQAYKQAIEYYKMLLRKNPKNIRAVQNLRIAQLKLPPEDQNKNNQQQQQQEQQQQQQQQLQQQQQQQQQQAPQPDKENTDEKQVLQAVQDKENRTRKEQPAEPVQTSRSDKPW